MSNKPEKHPDAERNIQISAHVKIGLYSINVCIECGGKPFTEIAMWMNAERAIDMERARLTILRNLEGILERIGRGMLQGELGPIDNPNEESPGFDVPAPDFFK